MYQNPGGVNNATLGQILSGSSKLMVPGRVTASSKLLPGNTSLPIDPELLKGSPDIIQLSIKNSVRGILELDSNSKKVWTRNIHWIRAIRLSDDCHSYNVQLKLEKINQIDPKSSKLVLQVVREIPVGEELLLWFSEEVLRVLQMVFLAPANIQGQKKYVCTRCLILYESPNPLKLHMMLNCGRKSIADFWENLSQSLQQNQDVPNLNTEFTFRLNPKPIEQLSGSAFKPVQKRVNNNSIQTNMFYPENFQNFGSDEAQIETLMSNLGKSREGHVCLYCGKCYSRKYGLKIHIRTHTGYKPLKCKFCLRPFGDPSNLNKHVRLHAEGETPYKCELCGKVLVRRRDLDRHLKSRHVSDILPERVGINFSETSSDYTDEEPSTLSNTPIKS